MSGERRERRNWKYYMVPFDREDWEHLSLSFQEEPELSVVYRMEDLKKLMKGRSASRRYVKKTITETAKILAATDQDVDKLKTNKDILCQESESLKKRDQEILNLIDEEKFEDEILECKEFSGEIQYCLTQIESKLKVLVIEPEVEREPRRESFGSARKVKTMKLPTLTLQKFSGNPTEWPSFWETFKAAIHSDEEMEDVMKFSYLKSYLILLS